MGSSPTRGSSFFLGKVTALGVLCCFALFVCLTLLASFFLPSHLSFNNTYMYTYMYMSLQGKLFFYPLGCGEDTVSVISTESLQVEKTLELDGQCPSLPLDNLFLARLFFVSLSLK